MHKYPISEIKFTKKDDNLEWLAERNSCSLDDLKQELKTTKHLVFVEKQEVDHKGEQETRFKQQAIEKENLYGYKLPQANVLFEALDKGIPKSAGIALGVERLLMALTNIENPFFD